MRIGEYQAHRVADHLLGPLYEGTSRTGFPVLIRIVPRALLDERRIGEARHFDFIDGIVAPIDFGSFDDTSAYVVIRQPYGEWRTASQKWPGLNTWRKVATILAKAHDVGLVHGHLSGGSVIVGGDDVTIIDFGLSPLALDVGFYAPEWRRGGDMTAEADQYSFGVMLSEFGPRDEQSLAVARRAMAPSPEARFPNMWEVARALGGPTLASAPYVEAYALGNPVTNFIWFLERHWRKLLAAGVGLAVVIAALGVVFFDRGLGVAPPTTGLPDKSIEDPHLNTWFETRNIEIQEIAEKLELDRPYWFAFDISRLPYEITGASSWKPSQTLRDELQKARNAGLTTLGLTVRPVLVGRGLRWPADLEDAAVWTNGKWERRTIPSFGAIPLTVDLTRFDKEYSAPPDATPRNDEARGGGVRLPLYTSKEAGCAGVALSLWRENIPLDHVVAFAPVGEGRCTQAQLTHSREATDNFLGALVDRADLPPNAALHLFELPRDAEGKQTSVAVYAAGDLPKPCEHYSWPLRRSMTELLAGVDAGTMSDARQSQHRNVAATLAEHLFPLSDGQPDCANGGRLAFAHLRQLAQKPSQVVFTRALTPPRQRYLPLHVLFALRDEQGRRQFEHRPLVVQPLPRMSYAAGQDCIANFAYVLPQKLKDATTDPLPTELRHSPHLRRDRKAFDALMAKADDAVPGRGTLLLILAHHANGELSFDGERPWSTSRLGRTFGKGSATVLAACSSAKVPESNLGIVNTLNDEANIDAAIVAPYDIPPKAGVALAMHFASAVERARKRGETPTLAKLFEDAVEKSSAELDRKKDEASSAAIREFFVAGNGGVRLCPSVVSASPASSPSASSP